MREGVDKPSTVGSVGGARDDYGRGAAADAGAGACASTREGKGRGARVKEAAVLRNLETNVRQLPGKILLAVLLPFSIDTHGPIRGKSYQRVVVAFKVGVPLLPHTITSYGTRDWELIRCIKQPSLQLSAEYCTQ